MSAVLGMTASILTALVIPGVMLADEAVHPICPLVLHQEQADRDERELAVELALSRLTAAESIFTLVHQLWEEEAVQRITYLAAKHARDVAGIEVKRQQLLLKRQEAETRQYEIVCSPRGSDEPAADRQARLDEVLRQYRQADCHRIGKDLAIAEVDLTYYAEVLASMRELREGDVATRQDVIRAERDVEMARKRVDHRGSRLRQCVSSRAAAGNGG